MRMAYTNQDVDMSFYKRKYTEGTMITTEGTVLPLKYTEVRADITGLLADVKVIQKFENNLNKNIEAVYVFPLPHDSAVNSLEIKIGERTIKGVIKEREEARRTYEEARDEGKKAGLLEQERANIFTMSVANIEPAQEILVTIIYYETVKYEDGEYEFVFPMTITPRYIDKTQVKDSEKISPPVETRKAGREINLFINLDTGFTPGEIKSPSHLLFIQEKGKTKREIQLAKEGELPDKDFILKYSSSGEQLESELSFYRKEFKPGTFMLHITPKMDYGPDEMVKRDVVFVLDRSGSMSGHPIEQARKALKACLRTLRSGDTFSVIVFDDRVEYMENRSIEFNDANLLKADTYIDSIGPRGGTDILAAMEAALKLPANKLYVRQIVFLTDGAVGNEEFVLQEIKKSLGKSRVFTFGIGTAVNRLLLDGMAEMGRGTSRYITFEENIEDAIQKFSNQTSFPVLTDISLEWKDASVADMYPVKIPDLYAGQVLYTVGRFHSSGKATAILKAMTGVGEFRQEIEIDLPDEATEHPVIETIWAGKRIDALLKKMSEKPKEKHEIRDEIIGIALRYSLMSPYTSLVAVEQGKDDEEPKEKKEIMRVDVPSMVPEGLNRDAFAGPRQRLTGSSMKLSYRSGRPAPRPMSGIMMNVKRDISSPPVLMRRLPSDRSASPGPSAFRQSALQAGHGPSAEKDVLSEEVLYSRTRVPFRETAFSALPPVDKMDEAENEKGIVRESGAPLSFECEEEFDDGAMSPEPQSCEMKSDEKITPEMIDLTFKYLARNQNADGSWSKEVLEEKKVISTSLAVLAFIKEGHTGKTGNYVPHVSRAVYFIQSNMDNLSGLSLVLSTMVFVELFKHSDKKKERKDAEKAIAILKDNWYKFKNLHEKNFASLSVKSAVEAGLMSEGELPDTDKWLSEGKDSAKMISTIEKMDDIISLFLCLISGDEGLINSSVDLLINHYVRGGPEEGSINVFELNPVDTTAAGIFVLSISKKIQ
ncbi:MAG: VIT domain-containing protein [Candidatus Eremiobacterota bacterium]